MNKSSIFVFILLCGISFSQEISFSKTSLEFEDFSDLSLRDTLFVINLGESDLTIDSIYSKNYYGYRLDIDYNGVDFYQYVYVPDGIEGLSIISGDSARFIFSDPDLCPICRSWGYEPFVDSIIIHSNSRIDSISYLLSSGYGLSDIVSEQNEMLDVFTLEQNYPNPFNPTTKIEFTVPFVRQSGALPHNTKLVVYDILGREIQTLINKKLSPGNYEVEFDGSDLPSGIYFYRLTTGSFFKIRKMILLK